jgi:hypothetical protein
MNNLKKVSCSCPICSANGKKQNHKSRNKVTDIDSIPVGYQNYHITLDDDSCSFYIMTNAEHKDAYYFITRWFLGERYESDYESLDSLLKDNGFSVIGNGSITEDSIHIDLNLVRLF